MNKPGLVLFSFKSHKLGYIEGLFKKLSEKAALRSMNLERASLKELHIIVQDNSLSVLDPLNGKALHEYAVVYLELWYKCPEQALATALYCERQNIPYFSPELKGMLPLTKVGEIAALADHGISVPDTFTSSNAQIKAVFKKGAQKPFDYPFILKAADGYGGKRNFLIKSRRQLLETLREYPKDTFIAQEFIPNDRDYRCLVLGGEIKLVLQRTRTDSNTHLNNTSAGAEGEVISVEMLSAAARADVLKAAKVLNRDQFAGVDLIVNKETGEHYILEVNQTPQIEIGAAVDAKMDALLDYMKQLGGERW